MKAKDLAALAALGVAGYAAYDKFGKKGEAKPKGKLGDRKSSIDEGTEGEYRKQDTGKTISVNDGDAGEAEARNAMSFRPDAGMRPDTEMRDTFRSDRGMRPDAEIPVQNSIGAQGREVLGRELRQPGQKWGGEGRRSGAAPAASESAPVASAPPAAAPAQKQFTRPGTQSSMGALSKAGKPASSAAPASAPASGNAAMGAYSQAQAVPKNIRYSTEAEKARQAMIDEKSYDSQLNRDRRQAVVDTVKNIPSNIAKAFAPPEKTFQNKTYVKDGKVVRYAKGGIVKKMASGGMTSSKPSSASSRGDGIAQRGKTRGTMR